MNYASGKQADKDIAAAELAQRGFTCTKDDLLMGQQDYNAYRARAAAASQSGSVCQTSTIGGVTTTNCQ